MKVRRYCCLLDHYSFTFYPRYAAYIAELRQKGGVIIFNLVCYIFVHEHY